MVFRRCLLAVALDVDSDDYGDESAADEEGHYDEDAENNDKECDDSIGLRHIRRPLVFSLASIAQSRVASWRLFGAA